jgi:superfamily II RNA helicase
MPPSVQVHGPTELVTSTRRPVPLTWHFSTRNRLAPLLNETGTAINPRLVPSRNVRLGERGWAEEDEFPEPGGYRKSLRGGYGRVSYKGRGRGRGRQGEDEVRVVFLPFVNLFFAVCGSGLLPQVAP